MSNFDNMRRWVAWMAVAGAVALSGGCGSPQVFSGSSAIQVAGDPPAPPPPEPKRVVVTEDRIQINEKIQFDFDKATIKPESHDLLNEVVQVIKDNPRIKKLSIEGHTDSQGKDAYNQDLSERRAASVRQYLVDHGIPEQKLTSVGHGESRPIADNETDAGREKNRRVEFLITEQEEVKKVFEVDPETGERREVEEEGAE